MDQISSLPSKFISSTIGPTFTILTPLLYQNQSSILSTPRHSSSYGPHPRQTLDIYKSSQPSASAPILIFLYGGGLTRGDKILDQDGKSGPLSLIYHNVGAFFAQRGFVTIIPDYRRVDDPQAGTGEGAVYPSGGEDVAAVLEWLRSKAAEPELFPAHAAPTKTQRDVFILGHSAGGVHLSTWLLDPRFEAQRRFMSGSSASSSNSCTLQLQGAVLLGTPLDFQNAIPDRGGMLRTYWPEALVADDEPHRHQRVLEMFCPLGLLRSFKGEEHIRPTDLGIPDLLLLVGELDAQDEIVEPNERFCDAWKEIFGRERETNEGIELRRLRGQNHISPPLALMTGDKLGEEWGEDVMKWMRERIGD